MAPPVTILLCLFCAASAGAQGLGRNAHRTAGRFGSLKQDQAEVQESADVLQEKQSLRKPLAWSFPDPPPEEEPRFPLHSEQRVPAGADSISVVCGENSLRVEAKKDLFGIGKPVRPEDVTLGGCPATGEDPDAQVLIFESELHGCGSQLLMTEDSLIYAFILHHTPNPLVGGTIIRTTDVSIAIECHYQKKHEVSSRQVKPTWTPFSGTQASEESLYLAIRLMTDDWQFPRPSAQFRLGDMMKFEVTVQRFHHVPLRAMVDSCVATLVPNVDTVPRYSFLGNNGCFFDSQLTGSSSKFLPRTQDDKLQFELEAFRFQQDTSGVIYITCSLRATAATAAIDATNKACSFSNGWTEASGRLEACACCDTNCGTGSRSHPTGTRAQWEQETAVGPISVTEKLLQ